MRISIPAEPSGRSTRLVVLAVFILCGGYGLLHFEMTDTATFSGDTWYYQSIAVNLAAGDGYRLGGLHDYADYKFEPIPAGPDWAGSRRLRETFPDIDRADFYGSPGLALFMAGVYRVVGVHPLAVRVLNLILVSLAAALITIVSVRTWRQHGLATGVVASLLFIFVFAPDPSHLLGEPLTMFLLAAWGWLLTESERHLTARRVVALGVLTAVLILVKSYVLLVLMTAAFIAVKHRSRRGGLALAAIYLVTVVGLVLPWSVYATRHSDRFVAISTQFDNLIMDGNNEDAISGGGWSPWWRKQNKGDPKYLYNRLADSDMSTLAKVGCFYRENWTRMPELLARKIYSATGRKVSVILILLLFIAYHVVGLVRNRRLRQAGRAGDVQLPAFPLFCFAVWLTNALIAFGLLRYTLIFLPFMLITVTQAPLLWWKLRQERKLRELG